MAPLKTILSLLILVAQFTEGNFFGLTEQNLAYPPIAALQGEGITSAAAGISGDPRTKKINQGVHGKNTNHRHQYNKASLSV